MSTAIQLEKPYQILESTAVGFLTLQISDLDRKQIPNPVGFCIARLISNYFEIIEIAELIELPLERTRVINFILDWSKRVPFTQCFVDRKFTQTFNPGHQWYRTIDSRQDLDHKYPHLTSTTIPDDHIQFQKQIIEDVRKSPNFKFAKNLGDPETKIISKLYGNSPSLQALAGAIKQIQKKQESLLYKVMLEQKDLNRKYGVL